MSARRSAAAGFTLVELLVTVTLLAVAIAIGVPSFTSFQRNSELSSTTNTLLAAINAARGEAMKRGMNAMVVPADGADWASGWVVFVDRDRSLDFDAGRDILIQNGEPLPAYLTVSGNNSAADDPPYILFDASGYSKLKAGGFGALAFTIARNDVDASHAPEQTRRIIIANTGRTRTCKPSAADDPRCKESALE